MKLHSYGMSLAIWDHSVTCHPTQVNTSRLNPSQRQVLDWPTPESGGMEGWVFNSKLWRKHRWAPCTYMWSRCCKSCLWLEAEIAAVLWFRIRELYAKSYLFIRINPLRLRCVGEFQRQLFVWYDDLELFISTATCVE